MEKIIMSGQQFVKDLKKDIKKELDQVRDDFKKAALDAKKEVQSYRRQFEVKVNDIRDEAQKLAATKLEQAQIKPVADALLERALFLRSEFEKNPVEALKNLKTLLTQPLNVKKTTQKKVRKVRKKTATKKVTKKVQKIKKSDV